MINMVSYEDEDWDEEPNRFTFIEIVSYCIYSLVWASIIFYGAIAFMFRSLMFRSFWGVIVILVGALCIFMPL